MEFDWVKFFVVNIFFLVSMYCNGFLVGLAFEFYFYFTLLCSFHGLLLDLLVMFLGFFWRDRLALIKLDRVLNLYTSFCNIYIYIYEVEMFLCNSFWTMNGKSIYLYVYQFFWMPLHGYRVSTKHLKLCMDFTFPS